MVRCHNRLHAACLSPQLSDTKSFAHWVTSNRDPPHGAPLCAGENLEEAIAAARDCNNQGMLAQP